MSETPSITWYGTATSGNVEKIGYDQEKQILYVVFRKTGAYKYTGVPLTVWNEALNAPSIGKFVHEQLKEKYPVTKYIPE